MKKGFCRGQVTFEFIITIIFVIVIFSFGVFIFQQKNDYNTEKNFFWSAQQVSDRFARNINSVYLLDNNSTITDYIFWANSGQSVELGSHSVRAFYKPGSFSDSGIITSNVLWNISSVNGKIVFRKQNNAVSVSYS